MIPAHAHQWLNGECRKCDAVRCDDRNPAGFRCVGDTEHPAPHRYADGTSSS